MSQRESDDDSTYWVYPQGLAERLSEALGCAIGWMAYGAARGGMLKLAERLADHAIRLHREGTGAIRAIGLVAGHMGRLAGRRGRLLVHAKVRHGGRFGGLSFYAAYDVAAFNKERALALISRFERDAVPGSLEVEEGALDLDDPGAEGVMWIARGRTFYREGAQS